MVDTWLEMIDTRVRSEVMGEPGVLVPDGAASCHTVHNYPIQNIFTLKVPKKETKFSSAKFLKKSKIIFRIQTL